MDLEKMIRNVPGFPKEGITFKDVTTLLKDPLAFKYTIDALTEKYRDKAIDVVVATEARGFIFGAPLAYTLGVAFVPVRKPGKLPAETVKIEYALEYGTDAVEIHKDAISPGQKVLIVDDLLATGGTVLATAQLVEMLGGQVMGIAFLIELLPLKGRRKLSAYPVKSLIKCEDY